MGFGGWAGDGLPTREASSQPDAVLRGDFNHKTIRCRPPDRIVQYLVPARGIRVLRQCPGIPKNRDRARRRLVGGHSREPRHIGSTALVSGTGLRRKWRREHRVPRQSIQLAAQQRFAHFARQPGKIQRCLSFSFSANAARLSLERSRTSCTVVRGFSFTTIGG
jgi:hypothetical protein